MARKRITVKKHIRAAPTKRRNRPTDTVIALRGKAIRESAPNDNKPPESCPDALIEKIDKVIAEAEARTLREDNKRLPKAPQLSPSQVLLNKMEFPVPWEETDIWPRIKRVF